MGRPDHFGHESDGGAPDAGPTAEGVPSISYPNLSSLQAGSEVGSFILDERLGQPGGQGEVWKAHRKGKGSAPVALKIFHSGDQQSRKWAAREKSALEAGLQCMPRCIAAEEWQGRPYIVMEHIPGRPLSEEVSPGTLLQSLASAAEARELFLKRLRMIDQIAEALHDAHEKRLLHRDIRPENILIFESEKKHRVWIIDWGLASNMDHRSVADEGATTFEHFAGTPECMAPEALESLYRCSVPSDIHSLGVVTYWLLCGAPLVAGGGAPETRINRARSFWAQDRHPHPGDLWKRTRPHAEAPLSDGEAEWMRLLNTSLSLILRHATHEDVGMRYRNLTELRSDLSDVIEGLKTGQLSSDRFKPRLALSRFCGGGDPWVRDSYFKRIANDAALFAGADALVDRSDHHRANRLLRLVSPAGQRTWEYGYHLRRANPFLFEITGDP